MRPVCKRVEVGQLCPEMASVKEMWVCENQGHLLQMAWANHTYPLGWT